MPETTDVMLQLCIQQGYVPKTCLLDGKLALLLTNSQGDACKGCNHDRNICHGRHESILKGK